MWDQDTFSSINISARQRCLLHEDIAAMEVLPSRAHDLGLGPMSRIPEGAEIEYCGAAFNEQTVKICWRGKFYFIFREDLQTQHQDAATSACC